jgi:molecular chaperone HtpG
MGVNPMITGLMVYLREASPLYYGKVQELREIIRAWLSYIPQTFPHYTRHTIEHSEEIILQLSKLLFIEEDAKRPTVTLSSAEAYILIASAYLHDAGMVASDSEKLELLKQDTWKNWTSANGGGERRWAEIQSLRNGLVPEDKEVRHFIADFQTRFLIAEFIRGRHHLRVADIIGQHQSTLGRFAFDDLQLQHAIANVCLGHGLSLHELDDVQNYP